MAVASTASAEAFRYFTKDQIAVMSCDTAVEKSVYYAYIEDEPMAYCEMPQFAGAMALCLKKIKHSSGGIKYFINTCGMTMDEFEDVWLNATKYETNATADPTFNETEIYSKPVLLTEEYIQQAWNTVLGRYYNYNYSAWFSVTICAYWFVVVFAAGFCNMLYFICPGFVKLFNGTVSKAFRRYVSLPATAGNAHTEAVFWKKYVGFLVPTRLELILIAVWYLLALVFNVVLYKHNEPNLYWPTSVAAEMGRKISDRSSMMCMFLIPVAWLFAGRNNFLQWFTGWSYARFMLLHRWSARLMMILCGIHTVSISISGIGMGKFMKRNSQAYVQWGYAAYVAGCIMCFQSLMYFRKNAYEIFVAIHFVLALVFSIGGWLHTTEKQYAEFFYASSAIWCFERLLRLVRIGAYGVRTAKVQLIADETLRVLVPRPSWWKPFPGCHTFIYFLRPTCWWQSHPFTIVDSIDGENTITLYLKVKGGATHGLYKYLSKQPDNTANIKVLVEGPYGNRIPVDKYDSAVFIAGGNGIPGLYYEAMDLAAKTQQRIRFYWVIRNYSSLEWFLPELKKLSGTAIEPIVYVTRPETDNVSDEKALDSEKKDETSDLEKSSVLSDLTHVEFRHGRPSVTQIIKEEAEEGNGSVAFVTCAHSNMTDEARQAVVDTLDDSKHRLELFEQLQVW